ncbi:hypothetical protein KY290_021477 [Solanum tuberosum]|uniref:Uncharacterized protein n=1 Tax=Solanum tuberosum TaxID=4113 RepID=A0ABQ7V1N8_SOLTU|nr:hypothetical protein KY289_020633 [Solanum tuberosum]KAH0693284.1 hypothetical protein KY285_020381 [Solanum tuberosum]KAH0757984.1 hypothetical protein KY290_021477 [Solanum tuberosum]
MDNASNVIRTSNINSMQHLTTKNSGDTRQVLVGERSVHEELLVPGTTVQEGLLVPGPEVQLLNISGKSWVDAPKTSDKVQGYQEGDTCVISCEDQVGPNAVGQQLSYNAIDKESVVRVGSEPADTTNDKIEIQEKTTNSKAFVVVSQIAFEKVLIEDVAINTAATFVAQIKEIVQSNIVDKAGVTVVVGAQIGSPGASLIKPHVAPKLNMVNSHALPNCFNLSSYFDK